LPKKKVAVKRKRRTKKEVELDAYYEKKVKEYKKDGIDGRPANLESFRRGFYHIQIGVAEGK